MSHVKDGLAKAWAEHLTAAAGFSFFPHRWDAVTVPPFGVVVVKRLRPVMPTEDVHYAELRVVVVTDTADSTSAEHQQRVKATFKAIEETPRAGKDEANGVRLCGFVLEEIEQAGATDPQGRKIHSDVFLMTAGVAAMP